MSRKNKNKKKSKPQNQPKPSQVQQQHRQPARNALARRVAGQPSAIAKLVLAIADPAGNPGVRLPTPEPTRTAVVTLRDQFDLTTPTGSATPGHKAGDTVVAFFGQPGRSALVFSAAGTTQSAYNLVFLETGAASAGESLTWFWNVDPILGSLDLNKPWPLLGCSWNSGPDLHGKTMAPGSSKGVPYLFMNAGDNLDLINTTFGGTNAGTLNFEVYGWTGEDTPPALITSKAFTFTNGSITGGTLLACSTAGYYAVWFTGFAVTSGTVPKAGAYFRLYSPASSTGKWQQLSHKDIDPRAGGDPILVENVRVNGASCLLTNTTAVTAMQGTVIAARIRDGDATRITRETLSSKAEKYTGMAMKGCYTFREFSSVCEKYSENRCGSTGWYNFSLDDVDYVYYIVVSDPNPTTAANSFSLTFDSTLEFVADSQRYPKDVASGNFLDLMHARRVIAHKPEWFYENPLHMSDVYNLARNGMNAVARGVKTAAPYLGTAMSAVDPSRANLYSLLTKMLM